LVWLLLLTLASKNLALKYILIFIAVIKRVGLPLHFSALTKIFWSQATASENQHFTGFLRISAIFNIFHVINALGYEENAK
jgi:hypothetical protein